MTGLTTKKKQIAMLFLSGLILVSSLTVLVPQAKGQSPAVQKSLDFFSNVLGVDLSKCSIDVAADITDSSPTFGNLPRETLTINLNFATGRMQGGFVFLNGIYTYSTISVLQGTINYANPLPADKLNRVKELLHRYQQYASDENLQDVANLLDSISEMKTTTATDGNVALTIKYDGNSLISVIFYSAVNGIAFPSGLSLQINGEGGGIADQTEFVHVGSSTLAVSPNEAVQIGLQAAKAITVRVQGTDGSYSDVPIALQTNPLSIFLETSNREPFTEYPMWYMFFGPDGSQNVRYGVLVYVWGDNGQVALCQSQSTFSPPPTLYPLPTPTYTPTSTPAPSPSLSPSPTLTPTPTPTPTNTPTQTPTPTQSTTPNPTTTPTPTQPSTQSPAATPTPTPTETIPPTPTPTPSPTPTLAPTFIEATTNGGSKIDLPISGNVSSAQMTNVTLTTDPSSAVTTLSFSLTGQSGSTGFGNITIPKSALTNTTTSTAPQVLIDGAQALNQSYTQDAANFYVSYTVHFSTHQVAIVFAPPVVEPTATFPPSPTQSPTPTPNLKTPNPIFTQGIIFVTILIVFMASIAISFKLIKRQKGKS